MKIEVKGTAETVAAFNRLKARTRQGIVRDSLRYAYRPVVQSVKQFSTANVETGTLKKSIGLKESNRPARCLVVIGPRRKMGRLVVVSKGRKKIASKAYQKAVAMLPPGQDVEFRDPVKYSHLLEFGHRIVRSGRELGRVRPYPFMQPAWGITQYSALDRFKKQFERKTLAAASK